MPLLATRGAGSSRGFGRFAGGGGLFAFTSFTFTNAGATGIYGPTLSQMQSAYAGQPFLGTLEESTGKHLFTIPVTGNYKFTALGACGGATNTAVDGYSVFSQGGGRGASAIGTASLVQGEKVYMMVGQRGTNGDWASGGGGSFAVKGDNSTVMCAAGGGGGNSGLAFSNYSECFGGNGSNGGSLYKIDANSTEHGGAGYDGSINTNYGYGGTASNGAAAGYYGNAGGSSNAKSYTNNGYGSNAQSVVGGFGGGGSSPGSGTAGAGGGWTGGSGSTNSGTGGGICGGGGSYVNTSVCTNTSTARIGNASGSHGSITVEYLAA